MYRGEIDLSARMMQSQVFSGHTMNKESGGGDCEVTADFGCISRTVSPATLLKLLRFFKLFKIVSPAT